MLSPILYAASAHDQVSVARYENVVGLAEVSSQGGSGRYVVYVLPHIGLLRRIGQWLDGRRGYVELGNHRWPPFGSPALDGEGIITSLFDSDDRLNCAA